MVWRSCFQHSAANKPSLYATGYKFTKYLTFYRKLMSDHPVPHASSCLKPLTVLPMSEEIPGALAAKPADTGSPSSVPMFRGRPPLRAAAEHAAAHRGGSHLAASMVVLLLLFGRGAYTYEVRSLGGWGYNKSARPL